MADNHRLSCSCCPSTTPYIYETIPDRLRHLAAADPDREAFVFYDFNKQRKSLTRKQLLDQATIAAENFVKYGVEKGSTVAICMTNSLEMLTSNLGVIMAGSVPFYVSANLKDGSDLAEFINNLEAKLLIIDTNKGDENWKVLENIWPEGQSRSKVIPCLQMVICNGNIDRETETRKRLSSFQQKNSDTNIKLPSIQPEDTLAFFCTSGSTGKPKEVVYTHFGILNWTKSADKQLNITEKSVFFCDRTFSWVLGFPRTYVTEGATRVFVDTKLSISGKHSDFLTDIIKAECCDVVYLPGYMVVDILKNPDVSEKFNKVQSIFLSGERIQNANYQAVKAQLCTDVKSFYGTTESGGVSVYSSTGGDAFEDGIIGNYTNCFKIMSNILLFCLSIFTKSSQS
jgi:acyl-coenzyme A synthetase/AMP-(fatty) acid ligase